MSAILVYITTETPEEADRIGRMLVERKLAACANVIDGMRPIFWWKGEIESGRETILLAKTKESLLTELTDAVKEAHSYEVPCVIALPIVGGSAEFIDWIHDETKPATAAGQTGEAPA
jgi:periplasmic divalent cation tolerance protein